MQGKPGARIAKVLGRVCGAKLEGDERFVSSEPPLPTRKPIGAQFAKGYGLMTVALWLTPRNRSHSRSREATQARACWASL